MQRRGQARGSGRGRRAGLLGVVLLGLLLGPAAPRAAAQVSAAPVSADRPTLEVREVGWDGRVVGGTWNRVRVRLTAGREAVEGRAELVVRSGDGPPVAYGQPLRLAPGASTEMVLWAPTGTAILAVARLSRGEQVLAEEPITAAMYHGTTWPLVGVLADAPLVGRQVELAVGGGADPNASTRLVVLKVADLPAPSELLQGFGALLVQGNAAATLTAEQRRSLRDWVAAGNELVLAGALHAPRPATVLPAGVVPGAPLGVEAAADLADLGAWLGQAAPSPGPALRYRAAGPPLVGSPARPLIWRFELGRGTIMLLGVDLELEPLATWGGTPALLRRLLEPALPRAGENDRQRAARLAERQPAQQLPQAVDALPAEAYPSWRSVALILGGFALLVGPGLHVALARTDRRGWLWVLVPLAALLASGGLYEAGVGREGRDVLGNVVAHVRLDPSGGPSHQALAAGFFAPTHPRLEVDVPGGAAVRVATAADDAGRGASRPAPSGEVGTPVARVEQGAVTRVAFDSNQWSTRTVSLERTLSSETGRIGARLRREGSTVVGSVRNETPYPLENVVVLEDTAVARLGTLAPGEGADVALAASSGGGRSYGPLSWRLVGDGADDAGSRLSAGPRGPEEQRRVRLLEAAFEPARPNPSSSTIPLTLLAFTRTPVGEVFPNVGGRPTFHLTLLEQRLELEP